MVPKGSTFSSTQKRGGGRHGGRVVLSLDVEAHVRDALRERASAAGVSMAEYLGNALAEPERSYSTAAVEIAQPLTQLSYLLAQISQALDRGDVGAAITDVHAAGRIVADALVPLRHRHEQEVRENERRPGGGWMG